jgi:hypothetical protein
LWTLLRMKAWQTVLLNALGLRWRIPWRAAIYTCVKNEGIKKAAADFAAAFYLADLFIG